MARQLLLQQKSCLFRGTARLRNEPVSLEIGPRSSDIAD
jgi:hypothetical protein